jgi:hypothetical protein
VNAVELSNLGWVKVRRDAVSAAAMMLSMAQDVGIELIFSISRLLPTSWWRSLVAAVRAIRSASLPEAARRLVFNDDIGLHRRKRSNGRHRTPLARLANRRLVEMTLVSTSGDVRDGKQERR